MTQHAAALAAGVTAGDRRALARAITLVESAKDAHRDEAAELLETLMPRTGDAVRVGVSGSPGAGKSTLIEAIGLEAVGDGHRVAVLAVDPSSTLSGGSILGDKTRMNELSRRPEAYIRPTPSRGTLGGVARHTREAILLCEAAGFDVVLVETVGVGQSEVAVADLVDLFVLVASPAGGDELQGIKRGIIELADFIVVNKADGELEQAALRTSVDLRNAIHLMRPKRTGWEVEVRMCSALTGSGIAELWSAIGAAHARLVSTGELDDLRSGQAVEGMWRDVSDALVDRLRSNPAVIRRIRELQEALVTGTVLPSAVARELLDAHDGA